MFDVLPLQRSFYKWSDYVIWQVGACWHRHYAGPLGCTVSIIMCKGVLLLIICPKHKLKSSQLVFGEWEINVQTRCNERLGCRRGLVLLVGCWLRTWRKSRTIGNTCLFSHQQQKEWHISMTERLGRARVPLKSLHDWFVQGYENKGPMAIEGLLSSVKASLSLRSSDCKITMLLLSGVSRWLACYPKNWKFSLQQSISTDKDTVQTDCGLCECWYSRAPGIVREVLLRTWRGKEDLATNRHNLSGSLFQLID
jgi:hypothetical protein